MSNFIPNSFQTPNAYVDQFMYLLSGTEYKVLCYLVRRIFGFQKRQDRVSIHQITQGIRKRDGEYLDHGTGLSTASAHSALQSLIEYGLVLKVADNNQANEGTLYELQLDSVKVDSKGLVQRANTDRKDATQRTAAARMSRNLTLLSDRIPDMAGDPFCATESLPSVQQKGGLLSNRKPAFCQTETQKPAENSEEKTEENQETVNLDSTDPGAGAPAPSPVHLDPEISLFHEVTGRFPTRDQIPIVIERWKDRKFTVEELKPYWQEWVTRDHKRTSLGWLDWVDEGYIPTPWKKRGDPRMLDYQANRTIEENFLDNQVRDPEANTLWQNILCEAALIPSIRRVDFETWIYPAIPTRLENNHLYVTCANKVGCDWLEQNFTHLALESLERVPGQKVDIQFRVASENCG
jgi:hypothetical protein